MIAVKYNEIPTKGRVICELPDCLLSYPLDHPYFLYHSQKWEWREIVITLSRLGYEVILIGVDGVPEAVRGMEADCMISLNLGLLYDLWPNADFVDYAKTKTNVLISSCAFPIFQHKAVLKRFTELRRRRNVDIPEYRTVPDFSFQVANLFIADHIFGYGNQVTLETFPERIHSNMFMCNATAAFLGDQNIKTPAQVRSSCRDFLWFGGGGVVLKGLDLCLEFFLLNPSFKLHIIGDVREHGFELIYAKEIFQTPNIVWHGGMPPSSDRFREVLRQCSFLLFPSASEGGSTAVATALQAGVYPIISEISGIDLPDCCGITLKHCTLEEIGAAIEKAVSIPEDVFHESILTVQKNALKLHSRELFSQKVDYFFRTVVGL